MEMFIDVSQFLATDKISAGHAKMMIGLTTEDQKKICDTIIGQKLSVRETEKLTRVYTESDERVRLIINALDRYLTDIHRVS